MSTLNGWTTAFLLCAGFFWVAEQVRYIVPSTVGITVRPLVQASGVISSQSLRPAKRDIGNRQLTFAIRGKPTCLRSPSITILRRCISSITATRSR